MRSSLLLLATVVLACAADVELFLASGRTVRGELVSETDALVTLRSRFPARGTVKLVESSYATSDILKRKEVPSAAQQYEERKARTPDTVPEQCTLAQWAYENCLREQARTHALRVLEQDAGNAWARRILDNCGYIEVAGAWVCEVEYCQANGLERVDGEMIPVGLADARRVYLRARSAHDAAQARLDEARALATGKAGSAAAAEAEAKTKTAQAEAAAKEIAALEKALAAAREAPVGRGGEDRKARQASIDKSTKALAAARDKQREAKSAADKSEKSIARDKAAAERAKASIAELEALVARTAAEMEAAAAKLPADDPVLARPVEQAKPEPAIAKPEPTTARPAAEPEEKKPKVRRLRPVGGGDD